MLSRTPRPDTKHKRKSSLLDLFGLGLSKDSSPATPEISAPIPNSLQHYQTPLQGSFIDLSLGAKRNSSHFEPETETPPKRRSYYDPNTDQLSPIQNVDAVINNQTISLRNKDSSRDYTHVSHSAQHSLSESLQDSESHCMSESQPQTPQTDYQDDFEHEADILQAECVEFYQPSAQPRFSLMDRSSMHSMSTINDACVRVGCSSPAFSDEPFKRESILSISTLDRAPSKRGQYQKHELIDRYLNSLYDSQNENEAHDVDMDNVEETPFQEHIQPTPAPSNFNFPSRDQSITTPPQSASSSYYASQPSISSRSIQVEDASFAMINPYSNGSRSSSVSVNVVPKARVASAGVNRKPVPKKSAENLLGAFEDELSRLDSIGTFTEVPPPVSYPSSITDSKLTPHPALLTARNTAPGAGAFKFAPTPEGSRNASRNSSQRDISSSLAGMSIATGPNSNANFSARHPQSTPPGTADSKSKRNSLSGKFGKLKNFGRRMTLGGSKPVEAYEPETTAAPSPRPSSARSSERRKSMLGFNFSSNIGSSGTSDRRRTSTLSGQINVAPVINMRFESERPDIGRGF